MSCCSHCRATGAHFGAEVADRDLERYRRSGPDGTTKLLLDGIRSASDRYRRLLDIGAGIGVLHHELLASTVERAVHVEAAPAYIDVAREEAARRGHESRVEYVVGDASELADMLAPAEIVALDRVICCYPDWERLVRVSASKATRIYAFSMPHDRWYVRLAVWSMNVARRWRGDAFRAFIHPVDEVESVLGEMGFRRLRVRKTPIWHVAHYVADAGDDQGRDMSLP